MRLMTYDRYIRGIKRRDGKPTAHEIRIRVDNPAEQAILGTKNLTKFLASGGDPVKANRLAQDHMPILLTRKRTAEKQARGDRVMTIDCPHGTTEFDRAVVAAVVAGATVLRFKSPAAPPVSAEPVTSQIVIDLWIAERTQANDQPKAGAISAYRRKLEVMLGHLGKPDDFRQISKEDLQGYRRDLITGKVAVTDKRGRKPNPHDHIGVIKSLFSVATRNGLITTNPTTEIQFPAKPTNTRLPFTQDERTRILTAARHAEPAIRWAHWLAAFTASIPSELRYLTPAHIYEKEGYQVVDIKPPEGMKLKTAYRPRLLPLASAIIREGFLDYVDLVRRKNGDDAPLFAMTEAQFDRGVNRLVRDCGITDPIKSFYSHRHFVASELEGYKISDEKGRQIDVSRYVAGHALLDVHERHYVHRSLDQLSKAIETLPH